VHQGIAVYGNKGSTDQHSHVQQLRDGVLNFFVTFVEVRNDRRGARGLKSRMGLRVAIISRDFCGGPVARCTRRDENQLP
jgi:glucose-6-phosphate isomerase